MFDLQGHRFARGLFPENTLEGLTGAVRLGLTSFEIDIAITRDGVPVVHHDLALNPNTTRHGGVWLDATGPLIRDLNLADLAGYDVRATQGREHLCGDLRQPSATRWRAHSNARRGAAAPSGNPLQHRTQTHACASRLDRLAGRDGRANVCDRRRRRCSPARDHPIVRLAGAPPCPSDPAGDRLRMADRGLDGCRGTVMARPTRRGDGNGRGAG